jgi:hypothetical protein
VGFRATRQGHGNEDDRDYEPPARHDLRGYFAAP